MSGPLGDAIARELACQRQPADKIYVRETEYGPELCFEYGNDKSGQRTVVNCTEDDLWALETRITARRNAQLAEYLAVKYEWERLVRQYAVAPGEPAELREQCHQAEARMDALKAAAGEGGPDDPLCCQRYSKLH